MVAVTVYFSSAERSDRYKFSPCSCYPAFIILTSVCVCGGGGGDENGHYLLGAAECRSIIHFQTQWQL